jgi:hypothetical protein
LSNNTGATRDFEIGQTLIQSSTVKVIAPSSDADAILLTPVKGLANAGTKKVAALVRGPCAINQDQLVYAGTVDPTEAAAQRADFEALGIRCYREPLKQGGPDDVLT